ncbi:hypothetical protein [Pseudomonas profundi]|uniref:hypothetical protein n=1 Tax=Pseudomonas profundi TaxID=1981513 RepID=UPI00123A697D|nr:hypothetical protein [Pseudomonas profundi]
MSSSTEDKSPRDGVWHVLNVGDPLLADERLGLVLNAVSAACLKEEVRDLALFQRLESEGRLHCELKLYFSPGLDETARSFGARPCGVPRVHDLSYVAGSKQAAQRLLSQGSLANASSPIN